MKLIFEMYITSHGNMGKIYVRIEWADIRSTKVVSQAG